MGVGVMSPMTWEQSAMSRDDWAVGRTDRSANDSLDAAIARGMTRTYILALLLFALAVTGTALMLESTVTQGRDTTVRLNLVERIDKDASRGIALARGTLAGEPQAAGNLPAVAERLDTMVDALLHGGMGVEEPLDEGFRTLPFAGTADLAGGLEGFASDLRALATTAPAAAPVERLAVRYDEAVRPALGGLRQALAIDAARHMAEMSWRHLVALLVVLLLLIGEAVILFRPSVLRTRRRVAALERMALRDPLTGLPNRRALLEEAERQSRLDRRTGLHSALIMVDIDRFKQLNDGHGHAAGDAALRRFARVVAATLRETDSIGRIGGEEFAVLLPGVDGVQAAQVAEKLRRAVAEDRDAGTPPVTVSIGVTTMLAGEAVGEALRRADRGLYRAKAAGRNRVVLADAVPVVTPAARNAVGRWRRRLARATAPAEAC